MYIKPVDHNNGKDFYNKYSSNNNFLSIFYNG